MLDIEYKSDYITLLNTQIEKESYDGSNSSTCSNNIVFKKVYLWSYPWKIYTIKRILIGRLYDQIV